MNEASLEVSASWPTSLAELDETDNGSHMDNESALYCAGPFGEKYSVSLHLVPGCDEEDVRAVTLHNTLLDEAFPRHHLIQFLPARLTRVHEDGLDPRAPLDPLVLPYRIAHV